MSGTIKGLHTTILRVDIEQEALTIECVDANDLVGALDKRLYREVLAEYFSHADLAALRHALNRAGQTNEGRGMLEHWARLGERILELEGDGDD